MNRGTLPFKPGSLAGSLSTGVSLATADTPLFTKSSCYWNGHDEYRVDLTLNSVKVNIPSDADLAFGQKLWTFVPAYIFPVYSRFAITLSTPTGLSSTAGEIGLGTVIGSGAVSVLSGTATFEDIHTGYTIQNLVAGTPNTETNTAAAFTDAASDQVADGSGTAKSLFLNVASAWNQTAAEDVTISGRVIFQWKQLVV